MGDISLILDSAQKRIRVDRAGFATCALLACNTVARGRTVVLLAGNREEFHELAALSRLFSPDLSRDDYSVAQPAWQRPLLLLPEIRGFEDRDAWAAQMAVFYALYQQRPCCVVASQQSILLRHIPKNFFSGKTLELATGAELSPDLVIGQLLEWGYERVTMVTRPGEMALRGDILDIFPSGFSKPARIEFFGDNIEDIRIFDAENQRSLININELEIIPALPVDTAIPSQKMALARWKQLRDTGKLSENDEYSLRKRLEEGGCGILPGLMYDNSVFFEDWLPQDALWLLQADEDSVTSLGTRRLELKEELEAEDGALRQPASLALRRRSQPVPWNSSQCVFIESLRIGVQKGELDLPERRLRQFSDLFPSPEEKDRPWQTLVRHLKTWQSALDQIILTFATARGRNKFLKLAAQDGILPLQRYADGQKGLYALVSPFPFGAELEWAKILVLGEDIIYPRADRAPRKASRAFKGLDSFEKLEQGDLLVHRDYGIGRYAGLHHLEINHVNNDFLLLEYSGKDKLYVPVDRLDVIQRFKGQEGFEPVLDKLGTQAWINGREKARKAVEKIAADLVEMYAYRKVAKSFRYDPPGELYHEFEATFGFEETPDQARTIQEVLGDMDKNTPMDRLVCGDVGFGKTEVALRAAFRAAAEGRQVALLCPTTVLAEQHYQTFRSRLAGFPINVGLLSRFVPSAKQKETIKACEQGQIDILVGTHRILSNDVKLPNLALLILDEEQRFGVRHKEKLKSMKKNVDVLTLTATPIPRTLQLSMSGIRDLSIIETAPLDRKPVASAVIHRDADTLRKVLERELARDGQVFWVYNRVEGLAEVAQYVQKLVPSARVAMAHGQMGEKELETSMRNFWHGEIDVLVCTSIIESGLDFPRANTLIVDQAQMFGLGQLYQLRGRVGRSDRQAYAFFVVPDSRKLTDLARERLRIIMDADYLGAGFQLAMEDLRLRGAGNILGEAQSGHITRVGLDMYLDMLEDAVRKQKGLPESRDSDVELVLGLPAHIPESYIEDGRERLRYYKALTSAPDSAAREETALGIRDRFGPFPQELQNFLAILDFKNFLKHIQVDKADIHQNSVKLKWRDDQTAVMPEKIVSLVSGNPRIKLLPPATLNIPFPEEMEFVEALASIRGVLENISVP